MTCQQFADHVEAVLAGDMTVAGPDVADTFASRETGPTRRAREARQAMAQHAATCAPCHRLWDRVLALTGAWNDPAERRATERGVERARDRLRAEFARRGRPPIVFGSLRTPIGLVFIGTSDRGVCDVTFGETDEDRYLARLAKRAPEVCRDRDAVAPALEEFEAYFAGRLTRFTVPIDLRSVTDFTARVLRATRGIPFGRLRSYGEIARRIGAPAASRAVGGALGRNPVPIIVPCHRVIAHGGRLGGYTGGLATKRVLLRIEGHAAGDRLTAGAGNR